MMMMKQWIKTKKNKKVKRLNDILDEIIDKSKPFEDEMKSLKKLKGYWPYNDFGEKNLKFKFFKIELQTCHMILTKSYLNKYLVINL